MRNTFFLIPAAIALLLSACQQTNGVPEDHLGVVNFEVTGKAAAQPFFRKGVLLLHSFEYDDAADAFREAYAMDPKFAMAYWGEAMTCNHGLWRYQDYDKANAALAKLAATGDERVEKARTPLEKDFMQGANILFGDGDKISRDSNYAVYMGELYKKYPGNDEVAAFYSVALIGSVPVGRNTEVYEHAADIAREVLKRNPEHPGALHYLIHAYDDPDHAALAMHAADAYAVVAPDAAHALHMPSHIYVASGLWDKVVSSNEESWAASEHRKDRLALSNDALSYHAYHWLLYGYLQQGRIEAAKKLVDQMQIYCDTLSSKRARNHLTYLKTTYVVETNDYTGDVAAIRVDQDDLNIVVRAMNAFTDGMRAYYLEDSEMLDSIIVLLTAERLLEEERASGPGARTCSSITTSVPDELDLQYTEVMELELKGMRAWMDQDAAQAEKYLKLAVDMERKASYSYGPPSVIKPSPELYADWLLQQGRSKEALEQYEYTLSVFPNRTLAVKGKAAATKAI